jgi:hypothetical protein
MLKLKLKVPQQYVVMAQKVSKGTALFIVNCSATEGWVASAAFRQIYSQYTSPLHMVQEVGWQRYERVGKQICV